MKQNIWNLREASRNRRNGPNGGLAARLGRDLPGGSGGLARMGRELSASVPSIGEDRVMEGWSSLDQREYGNSTMG